MNAAMNTLTGPDVPWWGVLSSAATPALLVSGWTVAGRLQPPSFNPVSDTVSGLMGTTATDRWVMTTAFLAVGVCYIITAAALRPAGMAGRLILIAGAVTGMLVAVNPVSPGGASLWHAVWAGIGFAGLALWPAGAWRRGPSVPWGLRASACFTAVALQAVFLAWFIAELIFSTDHAGLAERAVGVVQAVNPLTVVLSCRLSRPQSASATARTAG